MIPPLKGASRGDGHGLIRFLGTGTGSELRRPLGISMIGGLIFSQVLTLYTTPVIYLAFDRLAARVNGYFSRKRSARVVAAHAATPVEAA